MHHVWDEHGRERRRDEKVHFKVKDKSLVLMSPALN